MGQNTPRYSKLIFLSFWKALIKRITVWSCWKLHLLTYWPLTNFIFFLMNTDLLVTLGTVLTLYMIVVWRQKQLYFFFALLLLSFYLTQLFNELCETDRNLPPYTKFLWWEVFEYHSSYMEALFLSDSLKFTYKVYNRCKLLQWVCSVQSCFFEQCWQHWILYTQCCTNTSETTLHQKITCVMLTQSTQIYFCKKTNCSLLFNRVQQHQTILALFVQCWFESSFTAYGATMNRERSKLTETILFFKIGFIISVYLCIYVFTRSYADV